MAKVWSGVQVAIQSALASPVTINSISKANPGVVGYTGTDPTDGDYLYLSNIQGMFEVDQRVIRCAGTNGAGNTTQLEGVDTTNFSTFTSGQFQVVTFATTLSLITDITVSGGEFEDIDTTTIHDLVRVVQPGVASNLQFSMTAQWEPSSTALQALKTASDSKARRAIRFTFADGAKFVTTGYIGCSLVPTGSAQQLVTTPISIKANANASSAYAT
jgi:hypothetical protein